MKKGAYIRLGQMSSIGGYKWNIAAYPATSTSQIATGCHVNYLTWQEAKADGADFNNDGKNHSRYYPNLYSIDSQNKVVKMDFLKFLLMNKNAILSPKACEARITSMSSYFIQ